MRKRTYCGIIVLTAALPIVATLCAALADEVESADFGDMEWYELLTSDIANISMPASDNSYYGTYLPRGGGGGVRGGYMRRLKDLVKDDLIGYSIYDGLGLLDYKSASFSYNKPNSASRNVGRLYYNSWQQPYWDVKALKKEELDRRALRYMLGGFRGTKLKGDVNFYKKTLGEKEYNVLEYRFKENGASYDGWYFYRRSPDRHLTHYFIKDYKTKNKEAENASEMLEQMMVSAVLKEGLDGDLYDKYILNSARELILIVESDKTYEEKKDKRKNREISVKYLDTGAVETFDLTRKRLEDFSGKRALIIAELERLSGKDPADPKLYYALAVLNEYNDAGERYGDGSDMARALDYYKKAAAADNKYFYAHYNAGILYAKNNEGEKAIECFRQCITVCPVDILGLYMLGRTYEEMEDYNNAYKFYRVTKESLTSQEKNYCKRLPKLVRKKCMDLEKKKGVEKIKDEKNKKVAKSTMAESFYLNPEFLFRIVENNYTRMGDNLFSCYDNYIFWHGYLKGVKNRSQVTAKWYGPEGGLYKEDNVVESIEGDFSSYYFLLPIAETDVSKMPGVWKVEVFFEDELIDTKYFYILDC